MGLRTVRLDTEAEQALEDIRRATGMTISVALKRGLLALRRGLADERNTTAWEVYEKIDLGPGGYAVASSSKAKQAIREVVRRKHRR